MIKKKFLKVSNFHLKVLDFFVFVCNFYSKVDEKSHKVKGNHNLFYGIYHIFIYSMYYGKNIKYLRKIAKLNQTELGRIINKSKDLVSAYERQVHAPPIETFMKIASYFKVSLDDLVSIDLEETGSSEIKGMRLEDPAVEYLEELPTKMKDAIRKIVREEMKKD